MGKKILFWVLAVIISCAIMVYQRMTGPTYEKDYEISYQDKNLKFDLPRSHGGESDCPVEIEMPEEIDGRIIYRKFPTNDPWDTIQLTRDNGFLKGTLPHQPPAGKLEYHLEIFTGGKRIPLGDSENVVVRFKGAVPNWAQIPHILLMVLTVIWSTAIIFFALANMPSFKKHIGITIILLVLGGFIFGPIVQKYAFGQFWTGWPFGQDLTDNKVLLALVVFIAAWLLRDRSYGRWTAIVASLVMLAVYLIPHSLRGSELDPESGKVITGTILLLTSRFRPRI